MRNYTIPGSEPMYFAYSPWKSEIWVGDRANDRIEILALKGRSITSAGSIPTAKGIFHSFFTQDPTVTYPLSYTVCDIDRVTLVHDLTTRRLLATIPLPPVVSSLEGKPHDVTANADYAFITYIGSKDGAGYVASYDTINFNLINVIKTAVDPHVAIRKPNAKHSSTELMIAAQGGEVLLVNVPDLSEISRDDDQPSPHGMFIGQFGQMLYITNIAEGGANALVVYKTDTLRQVRCDQVNTSLGVPHNPATVMFGKRIFVTHSGAQNQVSTFELGRKGCPVQKSEKLLTTGINPFGILALPPAKRMSVCGKS